MLVQGRVSRKKKRFLFTLLPMFGREALIVVKCYGGFAQAKSIIKTIWNYRVRDLKSDSKTTRLITSWIVLYSVLLILNDNQYLKLKETQSKAD